MDRNKLMSLLIVLLVGIFFAESVSACALCGCRSRKQTKKTMMREHKEADHGHMHGDVRLDQKIPTISTAGLKALLDSRVPVTVLDARYGKYDDGIRIRGAKAANVKMSDREIAMLVPFKSRLVITYCANLKCPASAALAKKLKSMGYRNVIEMPYGIDGWKASGYPTQKANVD